MGVEGGGGEGAGARVSYSEFGNITPFYLSLSSYKKDGK